VCGPLAIESLAYNYRISCGSKLQNGPVDLQLEKPECEGQYISPPQLLASYKTSIQEEIVFHKTDRCLRFKMPSFSTRLGHASDKQ